MSWEIILVIAGFILLAILLGLAQEKAQRLTLAVVVLVLTSSCTTYPTCPLPLEANAGTLMWNKERGILEADAGGMDLFRNYIAARRVCGDN